MQNSTRPSPTYEGIGAPLVSDSIRLRRIVGRSEGYRAETNSGNQCPNDAKFPSEEPLVCVNHRHKLDKVDDPDATDEAESDSDALPLKETDGDDIDWDATGMDAVEELSRLLDVPEEDLVEEYARVSEQMDEEDEDDQE